MSGILKASQKEIDELKTLVEGFARDKGWDKASVLSFFGLVLIGTLEMDGYDIGTVDKILGNMRGQFVRVREEKSKVPVES